MVRSRRYSVASRIWVSRRRISATPSIGSPCPVIRPFRAEPDDPVDRVDVGDCAAVLVATRRVEVGDVAEQRAEEVAGEDHPILR